MTEEKNPLNPSAPIEIDCSRYFIPWLYEQEISIAFTTYQTNRLFLIGLKPNGRLSAFERLFDRAMGLYATPERLFMSSRYQLWQFDNALGPGELYNDVCDKLYVPRIAYTTGDLDVHDICTVGLSPGNELGVDAQNVVFVNTQYSCLAAPSSRYSFTPIWQPPFISKLAPEDRCHLNGLAVERGQPRYVTAISQSDVIGGWRNRRHEGGCLIDVAANEVVVSDLSMPHSPRIYQVPSRDEANLWLLNSGTGDFGYADLKRGIFEAVTFCPGYLRGLTFHDRFAIVGMSKPRNRTFSGLALDEKLAAKNGSPFCGLAVIDLKTGDVAHWLQLEGLITELYDVQVLPGVRCPMALGLMNDDITRLITIDPQGGTIK